MHLILFFALAGGTGAWSSTVESIRQISSDMLRTSGGKWSAHLRTLRDDYSHDPTFWTGVLGAIEEDHRPYATDDLRAKLLEDLRNEARARRLTDAADWATCGPEFRRRAVRLLSRYAHHHRQRFVLMDILTDLELWTDAEFEVLSTVFVPNGYGFYATPWLRLARANSASVRRIVTHELHRARHKPSLTVLAMAYDLRLLTQDRLVAKLITSYPADATAKDLRSTRIAFGANRLRSPADAARYRREMNGLLRDVFTDLRRRVRAGSEEPTVEAGFLMAARTTSRSGRKNLAEIVELKRLLAWFRSEDPAEDVFDVATSPCSESLFSRSAP